jgi:hypothetical protein
MKSYTMIKKIVDRYMMCMMSSASIHHHSLCVMRIQNET